VSVVINPVQETAAIVAEATNLAAAGSILIVEDDSIFGQRLGKAFIDRGFNVWVCETVDEAMMIVAKVHMDVVVTDLRLGQRSGLAVVEAVKRISYDTKTLVLSGYGNVSSAVTAIKLGATNVLSKPADADEILEVLGLTDRAISPRACALKDPDVVRWEHIVSIFEGTGKNVSKSARLLNMHRRTLQRMLTRRAPES
jgi:two-component system response regulator RegA